MQEDQVDCGWHPSTPLLAGNGKPKHQLFILQYQKYKKPGNFSSVVIVISRIFSFGDK